MVKVTVIMPVYNAEKHVEEAVNSILKQTFKELELIAIDDGSSDDSYNILCKLAKSDKRLKVYQNDCNKGVAYTRNRLIKLADSEYIALLDADDVAILERIQYQYDLLENNKDLVATFGSCEWIDENGKLMASNETANEYDPKQIRSEMIFRNVLINSTAFFRKSVIIGNGIKYKDDMCGVEDYLFWTDVLSTGAELYLSSKQLVKYRVVSSGLTEKNRKSNLKNRIDCNCIIADKILRNQGICLKGPFLKAYRVFSCERASRLRRWYYSMFLYGMAHEFVVQYKGGEREQFLDALERFVNDNANPICRFLGMRYHI